MTYTRGGHRVARYDSAIAAYPSVMEFSGEGELVPVTLVYAEPAFAKGGLVDTAEMIKRAGRNGDTEIVHVNKQELAELREMWGEPTINPQTGCPEYFLKKAWKGIKKIAKPLARIAPLAAMFIPSIGPLAAAGIGALSGGVTGGLKGALVGGALGGLGASGAVGKAIGSVAPRLSPVAARAAQGAVLGGLGSAAQGGNVLNGALTGGALSAAVGPGGIINPQGSVPQQTTSSSAPVNAPGISGASDNPFTVQVNGGEIGLPGSSTSGIRTPISVSGSTSNLTVNPPDLSPLMDANPKGLSSYAVDPGKPWLKKPFLGGAISPKISNAVGWGTVGALTLPSLLKGKSSSGVQDFRNATNQELVDAKFQQIFKGKDLPAPKGIFANLGVRPRDFGSIEEQYRAGYMPEQPMFQYVPEYAEGGDVDISEFAVRGDGDGREDLIDAKLSDGEYIIDAETVALLGNGSSKAGAKALDNMRVKIRKHKGRNLARGKFSVNAKAPERYMTNGR